MDGMTCRNCAHAYPVFERSGVCTGIECAASNLRFIPISEAEGCPKWLEDERMDGPQCANCDYRLVRETDPSARLICQLCDQWDGGDERMTAELDAWIVATVTARPGITLFELADAQLEEFPERYKRLSSPKQSARSRITKRLNSLVNSGHVFREKGPKVHKFAPKRDVWHYYPEAFPW